MDDQWYDDDYWDNRLSEKEVDMYDSWIQEFNKKTGFAEKYSIE